MKRTLTCAALVLGVGLGSGAQAQETMGRRVSRFDIGIYAGGSITSPWYASQLYTVSQGQATPAGGEDSYTPGYAPAFGMSATYWATPRLGVRLHGAYLPSRIPFLSDGFFDAFEDEDAPDAGVGDRGSYPLNNWLYDLDLVFRPWVVSDASGWLSSVYFFAGGGGLTADLAGPGPGCEPRTLSRGACLAFDPELASVGQGTLGAGMDLFRLTRNVGIFGELGVHGYDSPVHTGDAWVPPVRVPSGGTAAVASDRFAFTPRLVAGLKLAFGDLMPRPVPVAPVPPVPEPAAPVPAAPATQNIRVCVVEGAVLREVDATFDPATGDTLVMGRRFSEAYPATTGYAAGATWYVGNEAITYDGQRYDRFGLTRVVAVSDVTRAGEFQGVGVYTEAGATGTPDVVYVPVRPGCEFQPYQKAQVTRRVRG